MEFLLLNAKEVVILTNSGAASDDNFFKISAFLFLSFIDKFTIVLFWQMQFVDKWPSSHRPQLRIYWKYYNFSLSCSSRIDLVFDFCFWINLNNYESIYSQIAYRNPCIYWYQWQGFSKWHGIICTSDWSPKHKHAINGKLQSSRDTVCFEVW